MMLGLCLGICWGFWAQSTPGATPAQILSRAERAIYGAGATEASFESSFTSRGGKVDSQLSGRMWVQGERFRLEYGSTTATYSGGELSIYDSVEETLTLMRPSAEELVELNPLHFIRAYQSGFTSKLLPEVHGQQVVGFTPKKQGNISSIELTFEPKQGRPTEMRLRSRDGGTLKVVIKDLRTLSRLPDSRFVQRASDYPKAELVDLR